MKVILIYLILLSQQIFVAIGDEPPALMGDWVGSYEPRPNSNYREYVAAEVIGASGNQFTVHLMKEFNRRTELDFDITLPLQNGVIQHSDQRWKFEISNDSFLGARKFGSHEEQKFELKKVLRLSPTLGRVPPEGAENLFEGPSLDKWAHRGGVAATWKVTSDGVVEILPNKKNDLFSKKSYKDCELHLEFLIPYQPNKTGPHRGNSGLYLQGSYEVQILDSYGVPGGWADCGALYRIAPPKVNMSAPPGQWQTYDIVFRSARFDNTGKVVAFPTMTVRHNGVFIHHEQIIDQMNTSINPTQKQLPVKEPRPLILQDHENNVKFRNFWIIPLSE